MKVLTLIQKLSKEEFNNFTSYLKSPFHNRNIDIIILCEKLPISIFDNSKLKIWKSKFIEKNLWDENRFRKNCHFLNQCLQEFIMISEIQKDEKLKSYLLYKTNKLFLPTIESEKIYEKSARLFNSIISKTSEDLGLFFLLNKARVSQTLNTELRVLLNETSFILTELNRYEILNDELENKNLDFNKVKEASSSAKNTPTFNPIIEIYKALINMYGTGEITSNLSVIKKHLIPNSHIPAETTKDIIIRTTNYLITRLNQGDITQSENIWNMFKLGLELEALIPDVVDYRNIAYLACKAEQFNWALKFIEIYKSTLPSNQQESAYSYSKARIYGNMKNWNAVLSTLRNVEYEDIGYNLNSKLFIITAYFELDEYEALDSFIKSFKVFLRRRRNIPVDRKSAFYDFTSVIDHLMKAGDRRDAKRLIKAREVLESNAAIPNKDWLLEKIEEIESVIKK